MTVKQWDKPFGYERENQYPEAAYIYNNVSDTFEMTIVVDTDVK